MDEKTGISNTTTGGRSTGLFCRDDSLYLYIFLLWTPLFLYLVLNNFGIIGYKIIIVLSFFGNI